MSQQKLKEKKKPSVPLKTLNYAVLPYEKIKGTVWETIDDEKINLNYK